MNGFCISAASLILLETEVADISGGVKPARGPMYSLAHLSFQIGGKGVESMEGVGRGAWWMLPAFSGFLLGSEQLNSMDIS